MWKTALFALLLSFGAAGALTACDTNDGPAEQAGEKVDNAVEHAGDKMEQAGDKMEEKADEAKQ